MSRIFWLAFHFIFALPVAILTGLSFGAFSFIMSTGFRDAFVECWEDWLDMLLFLTDREKWGEKFRLEQLNKMDQTPPGQLPRITATIRMPPCKPPKVIDDIGTSLRQEIAAMRKKQEADSESVLNLIAIIGKLQEKFSELPESTYDWKPIKYDSNGKFAEQEMPRLGVRYWIGRKVGGSITYHIAFYQNQPAKHFCTSNGNRYWIDDNRNGVLAYKELREPVEFEGAQEGAGSSKP